MKHVCHPFKTPADHFTACQEEKIENKQTNLSSVK